MSKVTVFDKLGGADAVRAAVEEFYSRLVSDEKLARFFEGVEMAKLKKHQTDFLTIAFTKVPDDMDIKETLLSKHKRLFTDLGLTEEHFDLVAGHFVDALKHLGIDESLINEAAGVVVPLRPIFEEGAKTLRKIKEIETSEGPTLMEKLGGAPAVRAAVDEFYKRILDDPDLKGFFAETSMANLKAHQVNFMKIAFTKIPDDLDVPALLKEKHARLFEKGLNGTHFDKVAGHFVGALQHLSVQQELIDEAVGVIGPLRPVFEQEAK